MVSDHSSMFRLTYPDVSADICLKFLDHFLVLFGGASDEFGVLRHLGSTCLLRLHHCLYSVLHALLNQVGRGDGHGGDAALTALTIALKLVPIVELFLEVLNLEVHDDLDRGADVLEHLEPAHFF